MAVYSTAADEACICSACDPLAAAHEAVADAGFDVSDAQAELAEAEATVLRKRLILKSAAARLTERLDDLALVEAAQAAIAKVDAAVAASRCGDCGVSLPTTTHWDGCTLR